VKRLPVAYEFVASQIEDRRAVLVHCRQGRDRTGMFMAYFLKKSLGLTTEESIRRLKAVRPIALGAQGWDVFVREVLAACK
jgi:protein-tyrosine phosphatase